MKMNWKNFLDDWRDEVIRLHDENLLPWRNLGLPDPDVFSIRRPLGLSFNDLYGNGVVDKNDELESFYRVSDGWNLGIGTFSIGIAGLASLGQFKYKFPAAFHDALGGSAGVESLSRWIESLGTYLVLSEPDAREFVLLGSSGEIVLYSFSDDVAFPTFLDFMTWAKARLLASIQDMIASESV